MSEGKALDLETFAHTELVSCLDEDFGLEKEYSHMRSATHYPWAFYKHINES